MRQLLVEITAKPRQVVGVAQLTGGDHLVELGGPGLVIELRRWIDQRAVGARRLAALVAVVAGIAVEIVEGFLALVLGFAILAVRVTLFGARLDLAFALALLVVILVALVLLLFVLALFLIAAFIGLFGFGGGLGEFEIGEHLGRQRLERLLVVHRARQRVEIGRALQPVADQRQCGRGLGGRGTSRHPLAQEQAQRGRQRHFVAVARPGHWVGA